MKESLFSNKEKRCENCVHCAFSQNADRLVCEKKGLVDRGYHCFRYKYDPFKRVPKSAPPLAAHDASEFSLDAEEKS